MDQRILAITGMHRSGTSLAAEYLQACGLFIGDRLRDGGELECGSRAGHHEDLAFLSLADRVLRSAGVSAFQSNDAGLPIRGDRVDREGAAALFQQRAHHPQWGWKDPRTCLLLNFWNGRHPGLRYLFMIREPTHVVGSLVRRRRDRHIARAPVLGLQTWLVYNRQILRFYRRNRVLCFLLSFDRLTDPTADVIDVLASTFDLDLVRRPIIDVMDERFVGPKTIPAVEAARRAHRDLFFEAEDLYRHLWSCSEDDLRTVASRVPRTWYVPRIWRAGANRRQDGPRG